MLDNLLGDLRVVGGNSPSRIMGMYWWPGISCGVVSLDRKSQLLGNHSISNCLNLGGTFRHSFLLPRSERGFQFLVSISRNQLRARYQQSSYWVLCLSGWLLVALQSIYNPLSSWLPVCFCVGVAYFNYMILHVLFQISWRGKLLKHYLDQGLSWSGSRWSVTCSSAAPMAWGWKKYIYKNPEKRILLFFSTRSKEWWE